MFANEIKNKINLLICMPNHPDHGHKIPEYEIETFKRFPFCNVYGCHVGLLICDTKKRFCFINDLFDKLKQM